MSNEREESLRLAMKVKSELSKYDPAGKFKCRACGDTCYLNDYQRSFHPAVQKDPRLLKCLENGYCFTCGKGSVTVVQRWCPDYFPRGKHCDSCWSQIHKRIGESYGDKSGKVPPEER